jgi:RND family efflux transporter MFP subunit
MMAARAGADLAKATYDRYIRLMADESASRQEFDEVQAEFQRAKAFLDQTAATLEAARHRVKQAEAAVDAAAVVKEDASVAAPYDGVVTSKHVEIGDMVSQGVPLIALETLGRFRVDLVVPENQVHAIRTDQPIFVLVPSVAQTRYQGSVQTIVPTADPKSRTFLVKVSLPDPPAIRSGMFARGLISLGRENKLLVAGRSIVHRGQLTGVYAVDDKGVAQFRLLRLGNAHGEMVEVLSGLKAGTRYIVEPGPDVFHGVRVEEPS